ncbi:unnamed protein product [Symbiodinium necroappetens]|uniref:Uncharacterized protein n=1 Tax=Symbiodinium necroappetens TaxID=1628268 RepID=A0A812ZSI7_9DINO|nr:unnamed protein product [Symbiodinium necroappetens]
MNNEYWTRLGHEESVKLLDLKDPARTFPIFWHADGVRVYKHQKCWVYSYSCALKKGPSLSSKLLLLLVRETLVVKPSTHDRIGEVVGWIQRVLQTGKYPDKDINGQSWPVGSREERLANLEFAGGYKCAFSAFKGDWEARVLIHKLQRSYNHINICEHCPACKSNNAFNYRNFSPDAAYLDVSFTHAQYLVMTPPEFHSSWLNVPGWTKDRNLEDLLHVLHQGVACFVVPGLVCAHVEAKLGDGIRLQDLGFELENRVWKHYKAWCRRTKVAGCGHRFNLTRFGREQWGYYPELHSCYKAYTVKMLIYWVYAFLCDEDRNVPNSGNRLRLSYALAKTQWLFDRSGPFLTRQVKDEAVYLGLSFLLLYQFLAVENIPQHKRNWKIVPKFHSFLHLLQYVKRTSRNPRWEHCYQDEDLMKQIGNIASSTHPFTMDKVTCNRYRALLEFGDVF